MKMNDRFPVCGQPLDMEPGFYYGTNMVSYTLAILISVVTLILWWIVFGFNLWWIAANAIILLCLQPPLMRLSRSIWIYFFVRYSSNWDKGDIVGPFNVNKEHMNNW